MFLSIIVPVFNIKDYIEECVESLLDQDFADYEVILVDDGSDDGSAAICDRLAGSAARCGRLAGSATRCDRLARKRNTVKVIHKENGGLGDARNAGLKQAIGEYILFVDGDDYIGQGCLSRIAEECKREGRPDVMFLAANKVYPNGRRVPLEQKIAPGNVRGKSRRDVLLYIAGLEKYPGSAWAKLVSREMIEKNGLYFKKNTVSEDLDWVKRLLFCAKSFAAYPGDYYDYRQQRAGSITAEASYRNFRDISHVVDGWIIDAGHAKLKQKVLYSFACYEYKILLLLYQSVGRKYKKRAKRWLKERKWLLSHRKEAQIKMIRLFLDLFGIEFTSILLAWYVKRRERAYGKNTDYITGSLEG